MSVRQVIIVNNTLKMPKGKIAAQVAHASLNAFLHGSRLEYNTLYLDMTDIMTEWLQGAHTKVCLKSDSEDEMRDIYQRALNDGLPCSLVVDNGLTVFNGEKNLTTVCIGPIDKEIADKYTGHLKLL